MATYKDDLDIIKAAEKADTNKLSFNAITELDNKGVLARYGSGNDIFDEFNIVIEAVAHNEYYPDLNRYSLTLDDVQIVSGSFEKWYEGALHYNRRQLVMVTITNGEESEYGYTRMSMLAVISPGRDYAEVKFFDYSVTRLDSNDPCFVAYIWPDGTIHKELPTA